MSILIISQIIHFPISLSKICSSVNRFYCQLYRQLQLATIIRVYSLRLPYLYGVHVELQYKFSTLDSNSRFRSTPVFKLPYFSCPSILNHKTHQVQVPNPDKPDEVVLRKHHFMMCAFCHWSTKGESAVYHCRKIIHYLFHTQRNIFIRFNIYL